MSLHAALSLFLEEYPLAIKRSFTGDSVANFIRHDVPETIRQVIGPDERYKIMASAGQGNWARSPWAAVFDKLITETAQEGYYVVYLVKEDFSGIYISLNQGITSARTLYGAGAKSAVGVRAADYLKRLGDDAVGLMTGPIDLAASGSTNLSADYETDSICAKYYSRNSIPGDPELAADLRQFLSLYLKLTSLDDQLFKKADAEDDEVTLEFEDLRCLREHKRIERNRKLSLAAKRFHGFVCKACGFDFEQSYGAIGHGFIEAHHLTPIANLIGQKVALDPAADFTVLCSNCHRMIHKTAFVGDVDAFKSAHLAFLKEG